MIEQKGSEPKRVGSGRSITLLDHDPTLPRYGVLTAVIMTVALLPDKAIQMNLPKRLRPAAMPGKRYPCPGHLSRTGTVADTNNQICWLENANVRTCAIDVLLSGLLNRTLTPIRYANSNSAHIPVTTRDRLQLKPRCCQINGRSASARRDWCERFLPVLS
jgi:hypothetical protein